MSETQDHVYLSISTPLGKDALSLRGLHGTEQLSAPFHFFLDLRAKSAELSFADLVGKPAGVTLVVSDGTKRYFHGIMTRLTQAGGDTRYTIYHAELRPWFWLLTQTRSCRIFQDKSVKDIIQTVFADLGFTDYRIELKSSHPARGYCVQYEESSFDFVSRLLEDEGIFYYFEHTAEKHTLVMADDRDAHPSCPGLDTARLGQAARPLSDDGISEIAVTEQVVSTGYAMTDHNFELPDTDLSVHTGKSAPQLRVFEYPGRYRQKADGEARARQRIEACEQGARQAHGRSRCRSFVAGYKFKLAGHPRKDLNIEYVLRSVDHRAEMDRYENSFIAMPLRIPFRPPLVTPRPRVLGPQTAVVVGKAGEEIWTDKYGRIKLKFHWDERGKRDDTASCWIRVAQSSAGKGYGTLFLPRVGQEVVVTFLDGDPDRPLVTGAVYNAQQIVPYTLPAEQTRSGIKTSTSKGGAGSNELRFEDQQGAEEVFLHAERDLRITAKNDCAVMVTKNYSLKVDGDLTIEVGGKLSIKAGQSVALKAGTTLSNEAGTDLMNKASMNLTNEAGVGLTNQGGTVENNAKTSQTVDGGGTLILKGGLVKIN